MQCNNLKHKKMNILRLKELMENKGITNKILAKEMDVSNNTICNIVQGHNIPRKELLLKLVDYFDVDVRDMFIADKPKIIDAELTINGETVKFSTTLELKEYVNKL